MNLLRFRFLWIAIWHISLPMNALNVKVFVPIICAWFKEKEIPCISISYWTCFSNYFSASDENLAWNWWLMIYCWIICIVFLKPVQIWALGLFVLTLIYTQFLYSDSTNLLKKRHCMFQSKSSVEVWNMMLLDIFDRLLQL